MLTVACLGACGGKAADSETSAASVPSAAPEEIIEEIVTYYGCYESEADEKVNGLLEELEKTDSRQGQLWRDIIDYWKYANSDLKVNLNKLPDDLPKDDSICIVILGYQLNSDGTMQDELIGRLNVGLACAEQYPNAYVACTGGGTARNAPEATEGGRMGEWMLEHGLEEERLIVEDKSVNTAQNGEFTYNILIKDYPQVDSVIIVSSSYHIAWGSLLFEAAFKKAASENNSPELHVISNCAFPIKNDHYNEEEIIRWQTGGMFQLIGKNDLARQFYSNSFTKPELD